MLPVFLHFYPGLSRDEFYALTIEEYRVLYQYIEKLNTHG